MPWSGLLAGAVAASRTLAGVGLPMFLGLAASALVVSIGAWFALPGSMTSRQGADV